MNSLGRFVGIYFRCKFLSWYFNYLWWSGERGCSLDLGFLSRRRWEYQYLRGLTFPRAVRMATKASALAGAQFRCGGDFRTLYCVLTALWPSTLLEGFLFLAVSHNNKARSKLVTCCLVIVNHCCHIRKMTRYNTILTTRIGVDNKLYQQSWLIS